MGCPLTFPVPAFNTWSWGGAAATFWARLTHSERELVLVRGAAILNAIYDPVDPTNQQDNKSDNRQPLWCQAVPGFTRIGCRKAELSRGPGIPRS